MKQGEREVHEVMWYIVMRQLMGKYLQIALYLIEGAARQAIR
jgi:hypothetical protein